MRAVVYHGIGDIRLDDVDEPVIQDPRDALIRVTASAICGTDLHLVRGTMPGMQEGTVLGHEAIGVVEEVGKQVRTLQRGDRVVVCSTIGCGHCGYCEHGYYAQCDNANPHGAQAGTAFFGGPASTGPFQGLQAEFARIPFADVTLVKLPEAVSDDDAILLSDIFPTGYFAAELAEIHPGDTVAVLGCGPVGQFAIRSARLMGAERVLAVDRIPDRLEMAEAQGAEGINFDRENPLDMLRELTAGKGPARVIDAVGVDAEPSSGRLSKRDDRETKAVVAKPDPEREYAPGGAPSRALDWAVEAVAKAGTVSVVGVYPPSLRSFEIGQAMNKNLTVKMGNCNHRKYVPQLVEMVQKGELEPSKVLTRQEPMADIIAAYRAFDEREPGWLKAMIRP